MKNPLPSNTDIQSRLLLLGVLLLLISPAYATIYYVNDARPDDHGDGLSWATARKDLQTALVNANSGDQIWVAQGTYQPTTSTTDRSASFIMKEGVKIYGGFTSGQVNLTDRNTNPATNGAVLSGDIDSDNSLAGNSYHVIFNDQNGLTAAAVLDGFTVTGGNADDSSSPNNAGGGMFNRSSSPSLTYCSFLNNYAFNGGGIYNGSSIPSLTNCSFLDNAAGSGGGMFNYDSSPSLTNCSLLNNIAGSIGSFSVGGAMYNQVNSSPSLTNCLFLNNYANYGGGLYNQYDSSPSLINCSLLNNSAGSQGGGIMNFSNSSTTLTNCVLFGNGGQNTIYESGTSTVTANYNLFEATETDYTGSNNLTTTVSPFVSTTSAELSPCSPAIDAGNSVANATTTDLAGNPRKVRVIDIGAYEFQETIPAPYTATIGGGGTITTGGSANLTVTPSGGTGPYTVVYSGSGVTDATVPNYNSGANIAVSPTATTTYTLVSVTDASGCAAYPFSGSPTVTVLTGPQTRYVDAARPDDSGDGLSWATAHKYLQTALTTANSGDQIWVAQGTYQPTTVTTDRLASFIMKEGVKIYGGFTSGQINLADRNTNPATNGTVLSGEIDNDNDKVGNSYHVVFNDQNGLTSAAVLDGFTITGGNADGASSPNTFGAGMYNDASSPTLANCSFLNNSAGIGGGMFNKYCSPTLTNCSIRNNYADFGGGMYNDSSSPTLTNCSFDSNASGTNGGAMHNADSSPSLSNCSFLYNAARNGNGGCVYNTSNSSPSLTNCLFLSSTANNGGGMYNFVSSNPTLTNCSFLNNFVKNGGVSMANFSNSNPTLTNCVLFEDRGQNSIVNSGNSTLTATHSLFEATETDYTGSNNLTTTVSPFDSFTSAQLRTCSPAIDAGDDSANGTVTDLAGNPRKLRTIDMGAYEFQGAFSPYTATLSGGGTIAAGQSISLTVTLSGGSAPYTVVYSANGSNNQTQSNYTSGANIPISPTVTTTYTLVSVEDRNDCVASTLSGSATVIVQTPPIRYVDANRPDDIGNGLSWAKAHKYLQTALTAAQSGDQIWVAQGTYKPTTSTTDRTKSFIMKEGVKIYGGFNNGQLNMTDRDTNPATNGTVLSGDINSDNALSGNSYHVIFNDQNGLSAAAVLDGFTVMGGNANGVSFPNNRGGGIFNFSSNPTLANCSFQGNSAEAGGGLYDRESAPTLNYCTFQSNYANEGGGIANFLNSSPILTNCSFHGNFAINAGGMFNRSGSSPTLTNCLFQSNSATSSGGGVANVYSSPTLTNCSFQGNSANSSGGEIFNQSASLILTNCIVFGNGAQNTIFNDNSVGSSTVTATFTLFEASETDYTGSNNLTTTVSPFVSISSAQLSPCSPAIDAGLNSANATTIDLAGNQRLINGTIDMGAYEFQSNQNTFQRTWIGSLNSSWNEPGNWSPACLPTAADAVFINASPNDPIVGNGLSVHTGIITLNISVTLTVDNGGTLNVHGSGGALGNINMNSGILNQGGLIMYL